MTKRERVYNKFNGLCAYSGTPLEEDWQIDHIRPIVRVKGKVLFPEDDNFDNMVPVQKILNHYKHSYTLDEFRNWLIGELHNRLKKLPKKTLVPATQRRKDYLLKVASYFDITPDKPFSGIFYFEKL